MTLCALLCISFLLPEVEFIELSMKKHGYYGRLAWFANAILMECLEIDNGGS